MNTQSKSQVKVAPVFKYEYERILHGYRQHYPWQFETPPASSPITTHPQ